MIVKPKVRGFICTTAHPTGCSEHVQSQINYIKERNQTMDTAVSPKKVLVIGASTGYGLASRITASFGFHAQTIGVFFEKPASGKRTASAGWYNTAAFEEHAHAQGLYAKSFNGDAFSSSMKDRVIQCIQNDWGGDVDLVIYSLAAPRREDPQTGDVFHSALKTIGAPFTNNTIDLMSGAMSEVTIEPASEEEIQATEKVMGGEDWQLWIEALSSAGVLSPHVTTVAYSYIGPKLTYPIYHDGTIGNAKAHLAKTAQTLNETLAPQGGRAFVSINKCLVTQASAAIPIVPLYCALLYKTMKDKGLHEGCIEQMWRLFSEQLYGTLSKDAEGFVRLDDLEMRADVQQDIESAWQHVTEETLGALSDWTGCRHDFYQLFGFDLESVDYEKDIDVDVNIPSIKEESA